MKKYIVLSLFISLFISSLTAGNISAFLSYATFDSPEGPYVETYISIDAQTVVFKSLENGKFQGTVNILMTFSQNQQIKAFKKYELKSPEVGDTSNRNFQFIDQQRFQLSNGSYEFALQISDPNDPKEPKLKPYTQTVEVNYPKGKPAISGIELVKKYTHSEKQGELNKSGFDVIPYVLSFYPKTIDKLIFYAEIYNMNQAVGEGQKFLLSYYVETLENSQLVRELAKMRKEDAKEVVVVLTQLNIANLPTGNYNLIIEARNQQNEVVTSQKLFFQRSNPYARLNLDELAMGNVDNTFVDKFTNLDTLKDYVSSTYPISSALEKNFIKGQLKDGDLKTLQQYFLGFWKRRNPTDPEKAWKEYKYQVEVAEHNFGTPVKRGYQTDRGRVYLQYGPPNVRAERYNEPSNYPYEIWQYYAVENQTNRKFVFYSPDMVTSDFFLLHSDAIGEIHNQRWQVDLRSRIYQTVDITNDQVINAWGDMQEDYWTLPN
jgi:GWxTD domain-containing protein